MGCGKSTATAMLVAAGYDCIDSDQLIRDEVLRDPEVLKALNERFGSNIFAEDGAVDRPKLAEIVFSRESDRFWLEHLTHSKLFTKWRAILQGKSNNRWVIEVPLLFEKHLENWFDFTICVASSPALQLARLEQRGIPRPLAEQRISKQLPLATKIELSDIVLWNDGSIGFLQKEVDIMTANLNERFPSPSSIF